MLLESTDIFIYNKLKEHFFQPIIAPPWDILIIFISG